MLGVDSHPFLYDGALVWVPSQILLFEWLISVKKKIRYLILLNKIIVDFKIKGNTEWLYKKMIWNV